jgi:hypothetical protein
MSSGSSVTGSLFQQFKANSIHSDLLELGLHLGLSELSAEELADCFEAVCPCGKEHTADALKKQRGRVQEDIDAALRVKAEYFLKRPAWERLAVCGTDGFIAKAYRPRDGSEYVEITRNGRLEYVIYPDRIAGYNEESEISGFQSVSLVPAVFFVKTIDELFATFFPNGQSGLAT